MRGTPNADLYGPLKDEYLKGKEAGTDVWFHKNRLVSVLSSNYPIISNDGSGVQGRRTLGSGNTSRLASERRGTEYFTFRGCQHRSGQSYKAPST